MYKIVLNLSILVLPQYTLHYRNWLW